MLLSLCAPQAHAADAYTILTEKSKELRTSNRTNGWAYVVSGAVAVGISLPAYYLSSDLFAKVIYVGGQSLGAVAIGYGAHQILIEDDYSEFVRIMGASKSLTLTEKNELSTAFLREGARRARAARKIRVITHSIAAALQVANGIGAKNDDLSTALYFIGGVNAITALSYAVKESDEEKLLESLTSSGPKAELMIGPIVGLRLQF